MPKETLNKILEEFDEKFCIKAHDGEDILYFKADKIHPVIQIKSFISQTYETGYADALKEVIERLEKVMENDVEDKYLLREYIEELKKSLLTFHLNNKIK